MSLSRQLAAIMFTDIQGYTALMQQDEQHAIRMRDKHRQVFNAATEKHRGRILQYYGDGTLSIFDSAIDAVHCGIEMQKGFQKEPAIPVRIGIHTGDILFSDEEIVGDSVNVASRIESLAVPGSVFISGKVYDEIKNQSSIQTTFLKTFTLKNVATPVPVYAIANPGLIVPDPEHIRGKTAPTTKDQTDTQTAGKAPPPLPFLATKLFVPQPRPGAVRRPRLTTQLDRGLRGKLTLISAPAGFGKTSLAGEWIAAIDRPVAWLSLDTEDNDPKRFLLYLAAAVKNVAPEVGQRILSQLQAPQPPPPDSVLTALINELTAHPLSFLLVLDDYHVIEDKEIDRAMGFLLEHIPPGVHLLITTREDPPLPLARLRVRGQLNEIRSADLRFTETEAVDFLNQTMGLDLSGEAIRILEEQTEGWIAGLQMAALSLHGKTDIQQFLSDFSGSHRFVLDYLLEEVLNTQPAEVRSFLLQTAILDQLSPSLCDAVTGRSDGQQTLADLERDNVFLIPLDDTREWYRYHHLFGDVLRARLNQEAPGQAPILHQRASGWYEQQGSYSAAIRHALSAKDFERAARLIELTWQQMDDNFQSSIWLRWAEALPESYLSNRPVLLAAMAWSLLSGGRLQAAEQRLAQAERWLRPPSGPAGEEMIVFDQEQFRYLPSSIASARAYHAQSLGDFDRGVVYARQARESTPEEDIVGRGRAAALLGIAHWANGALDEAHDAIKLAMSDFERSGNFAFAISGTFGLADIRISQGRLREAIQIYEQALLMVDRQEQANMRGPADLHLGLADLYRERGRGEAAEREWARSSALGPEQGLEDWPIRSQIIRAKFEEARGDLDAALACLEEAERRYYPTPLPVSRPIGALKAILWVRQGKLTEAGAWVRQTGLSPADEPNFLTAFSLLTLARILIARYRQESADALIEDALSLLDRLLAAAENDKWMGIAIEVLIVRALAQQAKGNIPAALTDLEQALQLAATEGYYRIFADEGEPMRNLLAEAHRKEILPDYTRHLLTAWDTAPPIREKESAPERDTANNSLIDPLSERELEILQLIAQGLSNQQISERLFLALSTIKGHNQNIFGKLGVRRRTEAVAQAQALGIIS